MSMNTPKYLIRTSDLLLPVPMDDKLSKEIIKIIKQAKKPLQTPEVVKRVKAVDPTATRIRVLQRLRELKGTEIDGELIGSGKGVWIWWAK